jgi:acyl carrier protein
MSDVRTKLLGFIRRELASGRSDIDLEKESLVESGIIDSLGIMKLVDFIEKEFRVKIQDEDLVPENFETVDEIAKLLASKQ